MAHYAKITEENEVLGVLCLDDVNCQNENNEEIESIGQQYLETNNNWPAHLWIKTSYNTYHNKHKLGETPFRGNYAFIGGTWDSENQIFLPPKPFNLWIKNVTEARWQSPVGDAPDLTNEQTSQNEAGTHDWVYIWNENDTSWDLTNLI